MRLSKRLETILSMSRGGDTVADIGTDHGFAAIELVRRGKFYRALACDVRRGPLAGAAEHIRLAGLTDRVETRLGDGLQPVAAGEADSILIAGMGGPLMARILEEGSATAHAATELLLSPQSEPGDFRRYLLTHGYRIEEEEALTEDGKFYIILLCRPGEEPLWREEELLYGKILIQKGSPALRRQLEKEISVCRSILARLKSAGTGNSQKRMEEIQGKLTLARNTLTQMPNP